MSQETDPVNIGVSSDSIYKAREESMPQKAYKLTPYWKKHNFLKPVLGALSAWDYVEQ